MKEKSVGVVLVSDDTYLLLQYPQGHWDFVKGHVEKGESELTTMRRECMEETGITKLQLIPGFRETISYSFQRKSVTVYKDVIFYLALTSTTKVVLSHEHTNYEWLQADNAVEKVTYETARTVLQKAITYMKQSKFQQ